MASEDVIARRYARGLAEYAKDESVMDDVRHDLKRISDIIDPASGKSHVPELLEFLSSPVATPADKLSALNTIMTAIGIRPGVADFMRVLLGHNRVGILPRIARSFSEIAGEITGEYTAVVHTARPLSEEQARRLSSALSAAFGSAVHLHQQVEPGLLAGARVTIGDKTFDGTVLGRLHNLKQRLMVGGETDLETMEAEEAGETA